MEAIESARYAHSDGMGAYMCFMAVRLLEMRRILKPTGSLYLHCDPTASHYLKAVLDAIFGWRNFRNEIVWCYKSGGASPKRHFSRKHDIILWYAKTKDYAYNPQTEKSYNRGMKPYKFEGVEEFQDEIGWHTIVGMKDYWDVDMVGRTSKERMGYPTQKPVPLYERMIRASSNEVISSAIPSRDAQLPWSPQKYCNANGSAWTFGKVHTDLLSSDYAIRLAYSAT